jgi:hypothetical protein
MKILKKNILNLIFVIPILLTGKAFSQNIKFEYTEYPINQNSKQLKLPMAGGLNASQFAEIDLNGDNIEDLIIYDKINNGITTLLKDTNSNWHSAPQYTSLLPKIQDWLKVYDFNNDGKKDIFTVGSITGNIAIYKNISTTTSGISFELITNRLTHRLFGGSLAPITVAFSDYPSIQDIDGDGAFDIISYNNFGFGGLEYFRNRSLELGNIDTLEFQKYTACWGRFSVGFDCDNIVILNRTCQGFGGFNDASRMMHGGSTVNILDINNDGLQDLILSDLTCSDLYVMTNSGTNLIARFNKVDTLKSNEGKITFGSFPISFLLDANNDNIKDLIISTNESSNSDDLIDLANSNQLYINTSTSIGYNFSAIGTNFLQDEMLDLGETAYPTYYDIDNDGDLDLIIGTKSDHKTNNKVSRLAYYKNIGSITEPNFKLTDNDFGKLQSLNFNYIKPQIIDINRDGKPDLVFMCFDNSLNNTVIYAKLKNIADDYSDVSTLTNIRLTKDGFNFSFYKEDKFYIQQRSIFFYLYLGSEDGFLDVFMSNGSVSNNTINFNINRKNALGFEEDYFEAGFLAVSIGNLDGNGIPDLAYINRNGTLGIIKDFNISNNNPSRIENIITVNQNLKKTNLGKINSITIADLDGDTLGDITIGTGMGGILILKNKSIKEKIIITTVPGTEPEPIDITTTIGNSLNNNRLERLVKVYPSPSQNMLNIETTIDISFSLISVDGVVIYFEKNLNKGLHNFDFSALPKGLYLVKINNQHDFAYIKWIKN